MSLTGEKRAAAILARDASRGEEVSGPAVVTEYSATTVVPGDAFSMERRKPGHRNEIVIQEIGVSFSNSLTASTYHVGTAGSNEA